ncbi:MULTISPECIES: RCC1 domain-containing protein [unclassified Yoonia]|uniref:RCC1-like domain-containing protein n=1 Tax=unclassified Yoonia TaxID=2629118 RepID=UPI002AFEA72B|nr:MULTISPECIES: RCC1 domain-containing protein [unclassified Yoonia]
MSIEEYIRQTQLVPAQQPRKKKTGADRSTGARTARGGPAAIKAKGQTPFEKKRAALEEEEFLQDIEDLDLIDAEGLFPRIDDYESPGIFGNPGRQPDYTIGGVDENGVFIGPPPIGGHTEELVVGSGQGAGTGFRGYLYVAGEQINGEFGIGVPGAFNFTPASIVPGVPRMRNVGAGPRATYAVSDAYVMHVAGEGTLNDGEIIPEVTPTTGAMPDIIDYVDAGRRYVTSTPFALSATEGSLATSGGSSRQLVSKRYATPFTLPSAALVKSVYIDSRQANNELPERLFTTATPVIAVIHAGTMAEFLDGTSTVFATLSFTSSTPSQPIFVTDDGSEVLLPPGQYVVDIDWTLADFRVSRYNAQNDFVGQTLEFDGSEWTEWFGTNSANFYLQTSDTENAKIVRLESAFPPVESGHTVGVRIAVRSVFKKERIGVQIRRGRLSSADPVILARGTADIDPDDFAIGYGFVDVFFDSPITDASNSEIVIDTFGGSFEFGASATTSGARLSSISSKGSRFTQPRRLACAPITIPAIANAPQASYGRNLGLAVVDQVVAKFVAEETRTAFSGSLPIAASENGAAVGDMTTGSIAGRETDGWSKWLEKDGLIAVRPDLLALDYSDGSGLFHRYDKLVGFGDSTLGRLGFSGISSELRASSAPAQRVRPRAAISPLSSVIRYEDRLWGAGNARVGDWNAIPQMGIGSQSNPLFSNDFKVISNIKVAFDAWDLGGDLNESFLLFSTSAGLYATGKMGTAFERNQIALISPIAFSWIRCGYQHALMMTADGDVYVIGSNSHGQLALPLSIEFVAEPTFLAGGFSKAFAAMNKSFFIAV